MAKEKTVKEMAEELKLNPERFQTNDKNVLNALKEAYEFKHKKRK